MQSDRPPYKVGYDAWWEKRIEAGFTCLYPEETHEARQWWSGLSDAQRDDFNYREIGKNLT